MYEMHEELATEPLLAELRKEPCFAPAYAGAEALAKAQIAAARKAMDPQPYEHPYGPAAPAPSYALAAARHMHQFGTTREQLAEVAVAARRWAQLNPEAQMRDPLTIEQVLSSRMVADPLTVRDCCLVTDGAGAFVMTRADRARSLSKPPVLVLGSRGRRARPHWYSFSGAAIGTTDSTSMYGMSSPLTASRPRRGE